MSEESLVLRPIGVIHTPFEAQSGTPIQPLFAKDRRGTVEVFDEYAPGLLDLEGFDHIILLYGFHRSTGYRLEVVPYMDDQPHGLFSTRAPRRPNPIGLSVVRLIERRDNRLTVEQVDMLNGSPLYDIKPYAPLFDGGRENSRTGWMEGKADRDRPRKADDRFQEK